MNIDLIHGSDSLSVTSLEQVRSPSMINLFSDALSSINNELNITDKNLQNLAHGETQDLHEIMIQIEETKLSFQFLEQVRNRLLTAYQELMREQI